MEVFAAVQTLLAVRQFQERPVPDDSLRRILEAGRLTGSSRNGQPWHFIEVRDVSLVRALGAMDLPHSRALTSAMAAVRADRRPARSRSSVPGCIRWPSSPRTGPAGAGPRSRS